MVTRAKRKRQMIKQNLKRSACINNKFITLTWTVHLILRLPLIGGYRIKTEYFEFSHIFVTFIRSNQNWHRSFRACTSNLEPIKIQKFRLFVALRFLHKKISRNTNCFHSDVIKLVLNSSNCKEKGLLFSIVNYNFLSYHHHCKIMLFKLTLLSNFHWIVLCAENYRAAIVWLKK